eukprot:gnl/TRDRNA2_/TRDRNA2_203319_c0_seq1.p1 gnl/TRDRNA2_/TRDRNA2_203319_c0~~gnl/TRDRNA2_/TRDRNA2_203319_c0_seq1.p1  ORF type:complete len:403 (+),score=52.88 gnl/TRDRNA2_/TRDRNA2_203319_c0_seq1:143-1210(+)
MDETQNISLHDIIQEWSKVTGQTTLHYRIESRHGMRLKISDTSELHGDEHEVSARAPGYSGYFAEEATISSDDNAQGTARRTKHLFLGLTLYDLIERWCDAPADALQRAERHKQVARYFLPNNSRKAQDEWAKAPADYRKKGELWIRGSLVMEEWEAPYMKALAEVVCSRGGRILEIGYGLGISAQYIDEYGQGQNESRVTEHVIIEANAEVVAKARDFAKTSKVKTIVMEGFWQDIVETLEPGSFHGLLFDTFPISTEDTIDDLDPFIPQAYRLLDRSGIFTLFFGGVFPESPQEALSMKWWNQTKLMFRNLRAQLLAAGFANVTAKEVMCSPPRECPHVGTRKDRFLVPVIMK